MKSKSLYMVLFLISFSVLYGCTEEKAKAVKISAYQFNSEAQIALSIVENILKENMAMPPLGAEKIAQDLEETRSNFDYKILSEILSESNIGTSQKEQIKNAISEVKSQYALFSSLFRSLDKGHALTTDVVKKTEKHCMNLSLQLIVLADYLSKGKLETKFNSERILLFENIKQSLSINEPGIRKEHLKIAAKNIVQLRVRETEAKERAILQLLKAAEIGKSTANLIHDYDKLSINDVLTLVEETLNLASSISEQNKNITILLEKYKGIENTIRHDEYWSPLLDKKIEI